MCKDDGHGILSSIQEPPLLVVYALSQVERGLFLDQ